MKPFSGLALAEGTAAVGDAVNSGITTTTRLIDLVLELCVKYGFQVLGGLLILGMIVFVAFAQGWWIPLVPPALAWFLSGSAVTVSVLSRERKERALLMHLFSKHVSGEVAEAVWRQREQLTVPWLD